MLNYKIQDIENKRLYRKLKCENLNLLKEKLRKTRNYINSLNCEQKDFLSDRKKGIEKNNFLEELLSKRSLEFNYTFNSAIFKKSPSPDIAPSLSRESLNYNLCTPENKNLRINSSENFEKNKTEKNPQENFEKLNSKQLILKNKYLFPTKIIETSKISEIENDEKKLRKTDTNEKSLEEDIDLIDFSDKEINRAKNSSILNVKGPIMKLNLNKLKISSINTQSDRYTQKDLKVKPNNNLINIIENENSQSVRLETDKRSLHFKNLKKTNNNVERLLKNSNSKNNLCNKININNENNLCYNKCATKNKYSGESINTKNKSTKKDNPNTYINNITINKNKYFKNKNENLKDNTINFNLNLNVKLDWNLNDHYSINKEKEEGYFYRLTNQNILENNNEYDKMKSNLTKSDRSFIIKKENISDKSKNLKGYIKTKYSDNNHTNNFRDNFKKTGFNSDRISDNLDNENIKNILFPKINTSRLYLKKNFKKSLDLNLFEKTQKNILNKYKLGGSTDVNSNDKKLPSLPKNNLKTERLVINEKLYNISKCVVGNKNLNYPNNETASKNSLINSNIRKNQVGYAQKYSNMCKIKNSQNKVEVIRINNPENSNKKGCITDRICNKKNANFLNYVFK